jgi:hypothetical protein
MRPPENDIEAIHLLKEIIRDAVQVGVRYSDIAMFMGNDESLGNTIKQFVHRGAGAPRMTSTVKRLINAIPQIEKRVAEIDMPLAEAFSTRASRLHFLLAADSDHRENSLGSDDFLRIRYDAARRKFEAKYLYVRNIEDDANIFIGVRIKSIGGLYYFSLAIRGRLGARIVLGTVSQTINQIILQGLSYGVSELVTNKELTSTDFFDPLLDRSKYLSEDPLGVESISFPSRYLTFISFPVVFLGVDRNGNPISGKGIFFNWRVFEPIDVDDLVGVKYDLGGLPDAVLSKIRAFGLLTIPWLDHGEALDRASERPGESRSH